MRSDRDATIRIAESNDPNTAYAYSPSGFYTEAGDVWLNPRDYNNPVIGSYAYHTLGHELGHALGLKHGQETGGVSGATLSSDRDSMEFSIMTYRSYVGHNLNSLPYYTNETWSYAQSLIMYDIQAIQTLYGANFTTNASNSIYTFSTSTGEMFINGVGQGTPGGNRIFRTIWDGNGIDTYDFSNYATNLAIDLTPGGWTDLNVGGNAQRAQLNGGSGGLTRYARGHVFNALQYNGDMRSLIENATGGSGNDQIIGNAANNALLGNAGNDTLNGLGGNDTLNGGAGQDTLNGGAGQDRLTGGASNDTFVFQFGQSSSSAPDLITDFSVGLDKIDLLTASGGAVARPNAFSRASDSTVTSLATLLTQVFADANGGSQGNQALAVNSAALVRVTTGAIAGTYVVVNDGTVGFQSASDLLINITGFSGTLPGLGAITPSTFFV